MRALEHESGRLVVELHQALSDLDPARWHAGSVDAAREKLAGIQGRLTQLVEARWPEPGSALRAHLSELRERIADEIPNEESTMASARLRWLAFRSSISPSYEALGAQLRALEIHVPSLRPTNYRRNVLHVCSGLLAVAILYAVPSPIWAIAIATPLAINAWTLEITRRRWPRWNAFLMRRLSPVAHPHEHRRVNSATWYFTALALLALTSSPLPCAIGLAALGFGDPAAALVGRRFGRVRLLHGRTLEGSLAFATAATFFGALVAWLFAPHLALGTLVLMALAGGALGALAELLSLRVDDNLSVPLAAAAGAASMAYLLGAL